MTKLRSGTYIASPKRALSKNKHGKASKSKSKKPTKPPPTQSSLPAPALLYDLGPLVAGTVLRRPSATIRSPYVADIQLDDDASSVVLAHAPALDIGGLCAPGCKVLMKVRKPGGKTSHSIELVTCLGPESGPTGSGAFSIPLLLLPPSTLQLKTLPPSSVAALVGAHPRLGEDLAKEVIKRGMMDGVDGLDIKTQVTLGDSRVDFVVPSSSSGSHVIEVKNVVCADYHASTAPAKINANHCVVTSSVPLPSYERSGLFPWGRVGQEFEGKKVVSARAIKVRGGGSARSEATS